MTANVTVSAAPCRHGASRPVPRQAGALPLSRILLGEQAGTPCSYLELDARPRGSRLEVDLTAVSAPAAGEDVIAALVEAADAEAALLGAELIVDRTGHAALAACGFTDGTREVRFGRDGPLAERFLAAAARAASAVGVAIADRATIDGLDPADKALDLSAELAAVAALEGLGVPVFSEESGWIAPPPGPDAPWISLDPIDGTRNCLAGYPPWAVAVGLVEAGRATAGLVVDLSSGRRWWAAPNIGSRADGRAARPRPGGLLVLPSTAPHELPRLPHAAGLSRLRLAGATAVDLCRVADGSASAFLDCHRGISQPHDIAGASAVLAAAGAALLDLHTGELPLLDPHEPERHYHLVAAATRQQAEELRAAVGAC